MSGEPSVAIIGGGPAGLMAAEALGRRGAAIHLFDAMPSVGRKFLMAGKSGLNLTNAEPAAPFLARFGAAAPALAPMLAAFGQDALREWAAALGIATFIGSSGRVFPTDFKAAPLLRAWLTRLRRSGIRFHMRHRFTGWTEDGLLSFATPSGPLAFAAEATILALGGASWPRLGSDGAWVPLLRGKAIEVSDLKPANCGFETGWSDHFRSRFAGQPVKPVATSFAGRKSRGEFVVTENGVEGGAIYAHAAALRERIAESGAALLAIDLAPDRTVERLRSELEMSRGSRSLSDHLRRRAGIAGVKAGLLREMLSPADLVDPARLAAAIKALPLRLTATRPIEGAISSAGGIAWSELDERLMLRRRPGLFAAGEMIDWEAETGGYLLTACFATGRAAGHGAAAWLGLAEPDVPEQPEIGAAGRVERPELR